MYLMQNFCVILYMHANIIIANGPYGILCYNKEEIIMKKNNFKKFLCFTLVSILMCLPVTAHAGGVTGPLSGLLIPCIPFADSTWHEVQPNQFTKCQITADYLNKIYACDKQIAIESANIKKQQGILDSLHATQLSNSIATAYHTATAVTSGVTLVATCSAPSGILMACYSPATVNLLSACDDLMDDVGNITTTNTAIKSATVRMSNSAASISSKIQEREYYRSLLQQHVNTNHCFSCHG